MTKIPRPGPGVGDRGSLQGVSINSHLEVMMVEGCRWCWWFGGTSLLRRLRRSPHTVPNFARCRGFLHPAAPSMVLSVARRFSLRRPSERTAGVGADEHRPAEAAGRWTFVDGDAGVRSQSYENSMWPLGPFWSPVPVRRNSGAEGIELLVAGS